MGTRDGPPECGPPLAVYLDAFYIDITEVTVAQYAAFESAGRKVPPRSTGEPADPPPPNSPAVGVTWTDARTFARWAGKDLPTEAQWEKAARSEKNFEHPWGNGRAVWARARVPGQIDAVESFLTDVSPYGVFDLAGNAREWCLDWYFEDAFQKAAADNTGTLRSWTGPRAVINRTRRVVKGGGPDWKSWGREGLEMREKRPDVGFRCVLSIASP
jgi:formylglycine-generating enzyme required for sulfatase activity